MEIIREKAVIIIKIGQMIQSWIMDLLIAIKRKTKRKRKIRARKTTHNMYSIKYKF